MCTNANRKVLNSKIQQIIELLTVQIETNPVKMSLLSFSPAVVVNSKLDFYENVENVALWDIGPSAAGMC